MIFSYTVFTGNIAALPPPSDFHLKVGGMESYSPMLIREYTLSGLVGKQVITPRGPPDPPEAEGLVQVGADNQGPAPRPSSGRGHTIV